MLFRSLVVSVLVIAPYARVARANALTVSNREFVTAARSIGTNKARILFREVIPNVYPTLFAYALVSMGVLIILEATLSFLGIGMPIPTSSWGNMIAESRRDLAINVWPCVWPAVTLILTVFSINIVAHWIRKAIAAPTPAPTPTPARPRFRPRPDPAPGGTALWQPPEDVRGALCAPCAARPAPRAAAAPVRPNRGEGKKRGHRGRRSI